jgi:hypothetical protein
MTSNQLDGYSVSSLSLDPHSTPAWLSQLAALIFDCSDDPFRKAWTEQLRAALTRLDGAVPFRLVHDWHANSVSSLVIESCAQRGLSVQEHEDVRKLHRDAWDGRSVGEETWRGTLESALHALYFRSYPYDEAFALAASLANSYARSHGASTDEASKYGETYAELNTGANARLFSAANAKANSRAYAAAFARSDHNLLARAYPSAYVQACVSLARTEHSGGAIAYARLGKGLIESMGRG